MREEKTDGFRCSHCRMWVPVNESIGTLHRNHCPFCLWSKHLDEGMPGDRRSECGGSMMPVALTRKKSHDEKPGELMLVHVCQSCGKITKNRIAGDDDAHELMSLLQQQPDQTTSEGLKKHDFYVLTQADAEGVQISLFGKNR